MKLLVLTLITLGFSSQVFAKEIKCVESQEETHSLSTTNFSSSSPVLWSDFSLTDENGIVRSRKRNTYVSAGIACGILVDFKTECTSKENETKLGYQFSFTCPQKQISGSFYVDETGFGQFQCKAGALPTMNAIAFNCQSIVH